MTPFIAPRLVFGSAGVPPVGLHINDFIFFSHYTVTISSKKSMYLIYYL